MSSLEYLKLSIGSGFTDVTGQIQPALTRWAAEGALTGDALCCVAMASPGAGLVVTDFDPRGVAFSHATDLGPVSFVQDYGALRDLFARPSETFLVRGPTILGGRRVYVLSYRAMASCEVALTLL
jgi:hypothetical protein